MRQDHFSCDQQNACAVGVSALLAQWSALLCAAFKLAAFDLHGVKVTQ
jgi:hypothetical protein